MGVFLKLSMTRTNLVSSSSRLKISILAFLIVWLFNSMWSVWTTLLNVQLLMKVLKTRWCLLAVGNSYAIPCWLNPWLCLYPLMDIPLDFMVLFLPFSSTWGGILFHSRLRWLMCPLTIICYWVITRFMPWKRSYRHLFMLCVFPINIESRRSINCHLIILVPRHHQVTLSR